MTADDSSPKDGMMTAEFFADILLCCHPVRQDNILDYAVSAQEVRIKYKVAGRSLVYSPITGEVTRIFPSGERYNLVIENPDSVSFLCDLDLVSVNLHEQVNAGHTIGQVGFDKNDWGRDFLAVVASKQESISLYWLFDKKSR